MLNLYHLKYFLDAADLSSVTAAAKTNRIGPSAVSQAIRQLESAFGCTLTDHRKNSFVLTAEGRALQEKGRHLLNALQVLERDVRHSNRRGTGHVTIATTHTLTKNLVLPTLKRLARSYPALEPRIKTGVTKTILQYVESYAADVGIALDDGTATPLRRQLLRKGKFKVFGKKGSNRTPWHERRVWTTDLRNDRRIFSKQYRRIFKKDPEFALNVESWSLIADAIENDLGIGILPDFLENTNPKIVPIKTPIEMMAYDLCAFTRPDERISLNAELFLSELTRPG